MSKKARENKQQGQDESWYKLADLAQLSDRQCRAFRLHVEGKGSGTIAVELGIAQPSAYRLLTRAKVRVRVWAERASMADVAWYSQLLSLARNRNQHTFQEEGALVVNHSPSNTPEDYLRPANLVTVDDLVSWDAVLLKSEM